MAQNFLKQILSFVGLKSSEDSHDTVPTHFTNEEIVQQKTVTNSKKMLHVVDSNLRPEKHPSIIAETKKIIKPTPEATIVTEAVVVIPQCQATTAKGSQCRRKANLKNIHKKLEEKNYDFRVCNQHNNDKFMPFAKFITPKGEREQPS